MLKNLSTSATLLQCFHCGTDFSSPSEDHQMRFCCRGCEAAYNLLRTQGLEEFYQIKPPDVCLNPPDPVTKDYTEFDDPLWVDAMSEDGCILEIYLEGLSCAACVWLLEQLPKVCSDCVAARVNLHRSTVTVQRSDTGSFAAIAKAISRYGYRPQPLKHPQAHERLEQQVHHQDLLRLAVAGASAGNIMLLSVSIYAGATGEWARYFSLISGIVALPTLTWSAWPLYKNALNGLLQIRLNIDTPIVMAIAAGSLTSVASLLRGTNETYFDSITMLIFLLLSSRYLLKRVQQRYLLATHLEEMLLIGQILKSNGNEFVPCSLRSVRVNDVIRLKAGQVIPFDGILQSPEAVIETAYLTGESNPISISMSDGIESGSRALSALDIKATTDVFHSKLFKSLKAATLASQKRPQFAELSDQVGRWFLSVVMTLAVIVFTYFSFHSMMDEGVRRALALILVTCPCVFGFGIPLTYSLALQKAMSQGILVKSADIWSRLAAIRAVFFDKTGTLTTGDLHIITATDDGAMLASDWQILLSLESTQIHPVALAVTQFFANKFTGPLLQLNSVKRLATGGVAATVNGSLYSVTPGASSSPEITNTVCGHYQFKRDDQVLLRFSVSERIRTSLYPALNGLKEHGLLLGVLSGDQRGPVLSTARQLGFDLDRVYSQMDAASKGETIKAQKFPVMMVGDGANDAQALGAAAVGIAVQGGLDCSLGVADAYVSPVNLGSALCCLFSLSKIIRRTHVRNLLLATVFNCVGASLAISGWMSPLLAAVLMPVSSLLILTSTLWGLR